MKTTLSIYMVGQRDPLVIERVMPSEIEPIVKSLQHGATGDGATTFYELPFAPTQSRPQTVINCGHVSHYTIRSER